MIVIWNARSRGTGDFLPGSSQSERVMDHLHAFLYFLESLLPDIDHERCALALSDGIARVGRYLREISPLFARSDVYAQLLRVRLWASAAVPLDSDAAKQEAEALETFQMRSDDPRIDGGFAFGKRSGEGGALSNPVSTAFAQHAVHMWRAPVLPPAGTLLVPLGLPRVRHRSASRQSQLSRPCRRIESRGGAVGCRTRTPTPGRMDRGPGRTGYRHHHRGLPQSDRRP